MSFETLGLIRNVVSLLSILTLVLNLWLVIELWKSQRWTSTYVLGVISFNFILNFSPLINYANYHFITAGIFTISSAVIAALVFRVLKGRLRYFLFGWPVLFFITYVINVFVLTNQMGMSLFRHWIG